MHFPSLTLGGCACIYTMNTPTLRQTAGLGFVAYFVSSISQDSPPCRASREEATTLRLSPRVAHRSQAREGPFAVVILRPQAMESDKNYIQTGVTKSPFPLKGPNNLKVSCQACSCSILQSLPQGRCMSAPVREEETESLGAWPRTGLRSQGLTLPFRFFFLN